LRYKEKSSLSTPLPSKTKPSGAPWHVSLHVFLLIPRVRTRLTREPARGLRPFSLEVMYLCPSSCCLREQHLTQPGPSRRWTDRYPGPDPSNLHGVSQDLPFLALELEFTAMKVSASSYTCAVKCPQACSCCGRFCLCGRVPRDHWAKDTPAWFRESFVAHMVPVSKGVHFATSVPAPYVIAV